MKKRKILISLSVAALLFVSSIAAASGTNNQSGSVELIRGGFTINDHDPYAGGGTWFHGWSGPDRHYSNYDHKVLDHRSSVSNSSNTVSSEWFGPNDGFAYSWIFSSLTGNTANWATR